MEVNYLTESGDNTYPPVLGALAATERGHKARGPTYWQWAHLQGRVKCRQPL